MQKRKGARERKEKDNERKKEEYKVGRRKRTLKNLTWKKKENMKTHVEEGK
jgi:hypothetical protein